MLFSSWLLCSFLSPSSFFSRCLVKFLQCCTKYFFAINTRRRRFFSSEMKWNTKWIYITLWIVHSEPEEFFSVLIIMSWWTMEMEIMIHRLRFLHFSIFIQRIRWFAQMCFFNFSRNYNRMPDKQVCKIFRSLASKNSNQLNCILIMKFKHFFYSRLLITAMDAMDGWMIHNFKTSGKRNYYLVWRVLL